MYKRIEYIDTAKALGILLVILGHCHFLYRPELGIFIYSFHMPLFFIISCMFIKPLSISNGILKYAKAYMRPYFITSFVMFVITITFLYFNIGNSLGVNIALQRILWGKGSQEGIALFHDIPNVGAIWFFLALFWGCFLYSIIKLKAKSNVELCLYSFTLFFLGYISAKF